MDNVRNEWEKLDKYGGYITSGPLGQGTDGEWGRDYYKIRKTKQTKKKKVALFKNVKNGV